MSSNESDEDLKEDYYTMKKMLWAIKNMMLDLYHRFGEDFASTVFVETSKAQCLGEKRM